jgi:ribonuclease MRP protein subunit RMP1
LTADGQYASLGLTLLGCLAKARSVIRPFARGLEAEEVEESKTEESVVASAQRDNDLGEVISREKPAPQVEVGKSKKPLMIDNEIDIDADEIGTQTMQLKKKKRDIGSLGGQEAIDIIDEASPSLPMEKAKKKKKRKKADAFDDLFSSLL